MRSSKGKSCNANNNCNKASHGDMQLSAARARKEVSQCSSPGERTTSSHTSSKAGWSDGKNFFNLRSTPTTWLVACEINAGMACTKRLATVEPDRAPPARRLERAQSILRGRNIH